LSCWLGSNGIALRDTSFIDSRTRLSGPIALQADAFRTPRAPHANAAMSTAAAATVVAASPRLSLVSPTEGRVVVPFDAGALVVVVVWASVVVVQVLLCAAVASGDESSKVIDTDALAGSA